MAKPWSLSNEPRLINKPTCLRQSNTNFHSEAVPGFLGLEINSSIIHPAPTIWSFDLQSLFLQHISDLLGFKNSQQMICISPCWHPYGTENIQLNVIYLHSCFTKCIKNVSRAWLHISYLPAGILLSLDTHKRYTFTDKHKTNIT